MEPLFNKLLFISKLNNLNENIMKYRNVVNGVKFERIVIKSKPDYNVKEINNNLVKTLKISVECNAFDVNEDKQRQCYKQLKCFWPKCCFSAKYESRLNEHISHHLSERQIVIQM